MSVICAAAVGYVLHAHINVCECIGRSKSLNIFYAKTKYINIAISIGITMLVPKRVVMTELKVIRKSGQCTLLAYKYSKY